MLGSQNGSLSSLLTSSTVFVNGDLAGYYGAMGQSTFQPMNLPASAPGRWRDSPRSPETRGARGL